VTGFSFRSSTSSSASRWATLRRRKFGVVVHLAAQAGVRYSIENPSAYVDANLVASCMCSKAAGTPRSGTSYSRPAAPSTAQTPGCRFPSTDNVDHPVSLYAATKKANELMAHSYAHLYRLPCTGLRFFTVYGPWGRPDMALSSSPRESSPDARYRCSTAAKWCVISPMSTISSRESSG